ncbi:hypothetical protein NPIL_661211 [Nephila pilipes]|uniref:Uncharacterized protein n=1 Tax=Nephila pilipes TaxID=299642 RepID=A0A8X6UFP8_NEPPI|nr:hypothetical protein NPIL_661211 [Nephila pilipes]
MLCHHTFLQHNDLAEQHLNFFITGLMSSLHALVFGASSRWGRRPTFVSLMLGGASCAPILPVPAGLKLTHAAYLISVHVPGSDQWSFGLLLPETRGLGLPTHCKKEI